MDTINLPGFVVSYHGEPITGRLLEFGKLCSMFVGETKGGKDPSVKIMTKLTKYPPLRDVPALNNLLELVKDSAFAYQMAKHSINSNAQDEVISQLSAAGDPVIDPTPAHADVGVMQRKDYSTFLPRKTLSVCKKLFWELKEICFGHRIAMYGLQEAIETYQELNRKCNKAYEELQTSTEELYACTIVKNGRIKIGQTGLDAHEKCAESLNQYKIFKEKSRQAFEGLQPLFEVEKKSREENMKKLDEELRSLIEPEIRVIITDGIKNLQNIATFSSFPEGLKEEIESFDCSSVAAKIYQDVSLQYYYQVIEETYADMAMARSSFGEPFYNHIDKDEQRLHAHGSIACLLGDLHGMRQEELYVWANSNINDGNMTCQLKLKMDTKIKQKFCSADGKLAFGWIRKISCGPKKYGFYPTCNMRLAP